MHEGPTEPAICLERPTLANLPALAFVVSDHEWHEGNSMKSAV